MAEADLVPVEMIISTLTLSVVGFLGNSLIVFATIFNKALHNRCNLFIGLLAAADSLVCAYLIQLRVMMWHRMYGMTAKQCFMSSVHGLFALNMQSSLGLVIGFDRLLAVCLPMRYNRLPRFIYGVFILFCLSYSVILVAAGFIDATDDVIVPVCLPPTAYNAKSRILWVFASCVVAVAVVAVYGGTHIRCQILSSRNMHESTVEKVKRLLVSLTIVIAVYSCTWFITVLALVVTQLVPLPPSVVGTINMQLAWLVIINASCNFFIYFWRAPEYRKIFLQILTAGRSSREASMVQMSLSRRKSRPSSATATNAVGSS